VIVKDQTPHYWYTYLCDTCLKEDSRLVEEGFGQELIEKQFWHKCSVAIEKELK
jgi:hypothetical protein